MSDKFDVLIEISWCTFGTGRQSVVGRFDNSRKVVSKLHWECWPAQARQLSGCLDICSHIRFNAVFVSVPHVHLCLACESWNKEFVWDLCWPVKHFQLSTFFFELEHKTVAFKCKYQIISIELTAAQSAAPCISNCTHFAMQSYLLSDEFWPHNLTFDRHAFELSTKVLFTGAWPWGTIHLGMEAFRESPN